MSELYRPGPALSLATEVLEGVRLEDDRSPFAVFNFLSTVQLLYGERGFIMQELENGRMAILTPIIEEPGVELVAEGVRVDRKLIALLNPQIWTDQSLFDPRLVREEVYKSVFPATRRTISTLFQV